MVAVRPTAIPLAQLEAGLIQPYPDVIQSELIGKRQRLIDDPHEFPASLGGRIMCQFATPWLLQAGLLHARHPAMNESG